MFVLLRSVLPVGSGYLRLDLGLLTLRTNVAEGFTFATEVLQEVVPPPFMHQLADILPLHQRREDAHFKSNSIILAFYPDS